MLIIYKLYIYDVTAVRPWVQSMNREPVTFSIHDRSGSENIGNWD